MHERDDELPEISDTGGLDTDAAKDEGHPLSPGDMVDDFEILEEVGRGGMGIVYKAYERSLKRVVALKVLHPSISENPSSAKRFRQEAVLAANLTHPNIVPVFHIDQGASPRYFTMEFVQGRSIRELVEEEGFIRPAKAVAVVLQACEALQYAHQHNIIHRDIKPSNILLQNHLERVRITDFGIAQDVTGRLAEEARSDQTTAGTPAFMSPEQNLGHGLDQRTDIYSLGVTLYYMLTGRGPYRARTRAELAVATEMQSVVPPSSLSSEVGKAIDEIVLKMIEPDPKKRYADCAAVATDLQRILTSQRGLPASPGTGRRIAGLPIRRAFLPIIAGAALLIGVVTWVQMAQKSGRRPKVAEAGIVPRFDVAYETDFSTDPGWLTDQPKNYLWNKAEGTYHVRVENDAPNYQPNRYFYTPIAWTGGSFELQWDIKMTRTDWSAGAYFGLFDESITMLPGGQSVFADFSQVDRGLKIALYIWGAGGMAASETPGGAYMNDVWYICKLSYDAAAGTVTAQVVERDGWSIARSTSLKVPGGFTRPLVRLGGTRSGFGQTPTGYAGVAKSGVAEAEIDNVTLKWRAGAVSREKADH